jgi:hypothetical protein
LRETWNHAEREESDNRPEHRHQRRKRGGAAASKRDDGMCEQIDRQ